MKRIGVAVAVAVAVVAMLASGVDANEATTLGVDVCEATWSLEDAKIMCGSRGLKLCSAKKLKKGIADAVLLGDNACERDASEEWVWTKNKCNGNGNGNKVFQLSSRTTMCGPAEVPHTVLCCGKNAGLSRNAGLCPLLGQNVAQCQANPKCEFVFAKRTKGPGKGQPYGCQSANGFCGFDASEQCRGRCTNTRCTWAESTKRCSLRADAPAPEDPGECGALTVGGAVEAVAASCATNADCMMACDRCVRRPEATAVAGSHPHIVLSVADDMGWNDIGYNNDAIHTPVLDGLAGDGIILERHYAYRFCSPSRTQLLTGMHPWRHGQQQDMNLNPHTSLRCALQEEIATLPELLRSGGYKTHMVGKWHLGYFREKHTPTRRGFDTFVGFYSGVQSTNQDTFPPGDVGAAAAPRRLFEEPRCTCREKGGPGLTTCNWQQRTNCAVARQLFNNSGDDVRVVDVADLQRDFDYADLVLAAEAARVIRAHKASGTAAPMFLYTAWDSPHDPHDAPERFQDKCRAAIGDDTCARRTRLKLGGMMAAMDEAHAVVLAALKETGMWKNTILVFQSDNGGFYENLAPRESFCPDTYAKQSSSNNYPLRGGKMGFFEGGIRTAAFISGGKNALPNAVRGTKSSALMSSADWVRTLLGAGGLELTSGARDQALDSVDQWGALLAQASSPRTELPVQVWGRAKRNVLLLMHQGSIIKLISGYPGYMGGIEWIRPASPVRRREPMDAIHVPVEMDIADVPAALLDAEPTYLCKANSPCIFNVTGDPSETNNLAGDEELRSLLEAALQRYQSLETPFPNSGLCRAKGTDMLFDTAAFTRARACNAYVSWLQDSSGDPQPCPPEILPDLQPVVVPDLRR